MNIVIGLAILMTVGFILVVVNYINEIERRVTLLEHPFLSDVPPSENLYHADDDKDWPNFKEKK